MTDTAANQVLISIADNPQAAARLWGPQDAHRRLLERRLQVRLAVRGAQVSVNGDADRLPMAERVLRQLLRVAGNGGNVFLQDIEQAIHLLEQDTSVDLDELRKQPVLTTREHRTVTPKTTNQRAYLQAIAENDLVFGVGPAGTGKTYLAMAAAAAALQRREVKRIILARPAVEAGEKLGFLPGSLAEKVNPYLRPLYDALYDMMDIERAARLVEDGTIEVAPLAFMRGRTLNNSFVIMDEAQNATREQMKMFLTRLGFSSKAVVTGDLTQTDLPAHKDSGLDHAVRLLQGVEGIAVVRFSHVDVVRHPLVQRIVLAYDAEGNR
jgi:phosphate starvation-inducible PhoH-like protein